MSNKLHVKTIILQTCLRLVTRLPKLGEFKLDKNPRNAYRIVETLIVVEEFSNLSGDPSFISNRTVKEEVSKKCRITTDSSNKT